MVCFRGRPPSWRRWRTHCFWLLLRYLLACVSQLWERTPWSGVPHEHHPLVKCVHAKWPLHKHEWVRMREWPRGYVHA
jgi:hypothetical protein